MLAALIPVSGLCEVAQTPLTVSQVVKPRVLFAVSNDHALYYKAYTDWNDLDEENNDGPEVSYKHGFEYYGYFDPQKCYDYDADAKRFEPKAVAPKTGVGKGYCNEVKGAWSGNFLNWASMSRMDIVRKVLYGGYRSTDTTDTTVLERAFLPTDAHSFAKYYRGSDIPKLTPFTGEQTTVDSARGPELTLCNTTYADDGQSQNVTDPPLIRVVKGDFRYWAANERWQCTWDDEHGDDSSGTNTTGSHTSDPDKDNDGLGEEEYVARVRVCESGLLGSEDCENYPSGSLKPVGLLHHYGEKDEMQFGLITGSYQKNKSGGVLRKNLSAFSDEVNVTTDGTYTDVDGIVKTLDRLRIARYNFGDGTYNTTDNCIWGLSSFTDGNCSNWGNPLSEMYLEAVRYYAGKSATANFAATDSGYIPGLTSASWSDPIDSANWCAHCDIIVFNASEPSYDNDGLSNDLAVTATTQTDAVGVDEGITGHAWFVGENGTDNNQLCTGKTVTAFGSVEGACPGAPRLDGSYQVSGLAHWARTQDIRSDREGDQNITTRAVTLLPAAPRIRIRVPGSERVLSILPACRNTKPNPDGNCAIVDFKILEQDVAAGTGKAYVNWEDSEQGGDYDQDMKGTLSWNVGASTIRVTTKVDAESTDHPLGFGYVISGTTKDGFHVHSGIEGFSYTDPSAVPGCASCNRSDDPTSYTYNIGDSTAGLLEEPLWYAAKYGSFKDSNDNKKPDLPAEWDQDGDGRPDGFFSANNPADLGPSLARFLDVIATTTSSASVALNTINLLGDTRIYQARFDSDFWFGDLVAFPVGEDGSLEDPVWHGRDTVTAQARAGDRRIITSYEDSDPSHRDGVPFRWDDLAEPQQDRLRVMCKDCAPVSEEAGRALLDYARGEDDDEVRNGGDFRDREYLLGDIVNSEPAYIGPPRSYLPDGLEADPYSVFADAHKNRTPVLYAGANDGMLHGFDVEVGAATEGSELFGYVPRAAYPKLSRLAKLDQRTHHQFYVDGAIVAADVHLGSGLKWRTILVAATAAGGPGVFALDITDPEAFRSNESDAAGRVLWDIVGDITDDSSEDVEGDDGFEDLGYTFSKPAVVRLPNSSHGGAWAAVFGNGYESADGKAVLYIVDAATGERLEAVEADGGPDNGLSSVSPIDHDGDAVVDYIYAGDLRGNLWRFEPNDGGGWMVSFGGSELFRTGPDDAITETDDDDTETTRVTRKKVCEWVLKNPRKPNKGYKRKCHWEETEETDETDDDSTTSVPGDTRPITVRPEVIRHPLGGVLVLFGTGTYYQGADRQPDTEHTNSFYGVWDRFDGTAGIRREHLLPQQIVAERLHAGFDVRLTTANDVAWHTDPGKPLDNPPMSHLGWYMDLLSSGGTRKGEMQVTDPVARGSRIIFTTMIPSPAPCEFGGDGWLMELNAVDGSQLENVLFDLNGDGEFTAADMVEVTITGENGEQETIQVSPSGKKSKVGIIQKPAIVAAGTKEYKFTSGSKNAEIESTTENPGLRAGGRRSWIQLY